jgi:hypothetical protein
MATAFQWTLSSPGDGTSMPSIRAAEQPRDILRLRPLHRLAEIGRDPLPHELERQQTARDGPVEADDVKAVGRLHRLAADRARLHRRQGPFEQRRRLAAADLAEIAAELGRGTGGMPARQLGEGQSPPVRR